MIAVMKPGETVPGVVVLEAAGAKQARRTQGSGAIPGGSDRTCSDQVDHLGSIAA